jgi:hypothetical protein
MLRSMVSSKSFLVSPILCVGLSLILAAGCGDRRELFYPSLANAISAGEINRGWIPDFLPESSRAIHIIYDPASPRTYCAFDFSTDDSHRLRKRLTNLDALPTSVKYVPHSGVSWWPAMLKGNLDVGKIREAGFKVYLDEEPGTSVETDVLLFAIDWTNGRGFFYRTNK